MPKKIFVQNVYQVLLKKTEKLFAEFLPSRDLKISSSKDMSARIAGIYGLTTTIWEFSPSK